MSRIGENIYKRKDGRWEGRYRIQGTKKYGSVYAHTYSEVRDKLILEKVNQLKYEPESYSLKMYCLEWLEWKKVRIKCSSYNKYKNLVDSYIIPYFNSLSFLELDHFKIESFTNYLLKRNLSSKTINDTLSVLRQIIQYGNINNSAGIQISINIKGISSSEQKELQVLTSSQQAILYSYCKENMNDKNLGILICLFTGIRIGELCALKWDDISIVDHTLRIDKTMQRIQTHGTPKTIISITKPKSQCSIRTIPLCDEIYELLKKNKKTGYVLSGNEKYVEPRSMQTYFKKVTKACNIEQVNFHCLRHSFATRCVESGFDVKSLSEILGHASVNITMNRYVHPSMDLKRQNMQRLNQF